jgi:hypothetical protein
MPRTQDLEIQEKQRAREEIAAQVETFLRRGGQIQVIEDSCREDSGPRGSVWSSNREALDVSTLG